MPVLLGPVTAGASAAPPQAAPQAPPASAPPPAESATAAQTAAITAAIFHIEVVPTADARNLKIRPGGPEEYGYVLFDGPPGENSLIFDGKPLALPTKLHLPTGKYEIRTVNAGKVVKTQSLEVTPLSIQMFMVVRP